jgi:hypothetical protein
MCKECEVKLTRIAIAAVVLLALACIPTNPGDKPGWGLFPGATGSNASGSTPGVVVLGDSLVFNANVQTLADMIRFWRGTSSVVAAAGGASWAHFNKATLIGPSGLGTIQNYADFFHPRIIVIALGSNDARIITGEVSDPYGYRVNEYKDQAFWGTVGALNSSGCVALINVADHWSESASSQVIAEVNQGLTNLDNASERIFTFDWNGFSAPHPEWFVSPTNIHHTPAGQAAYRDFINNAIAATMASGC